MTAKTKKDNVTIIKKYANRRLYDTGRSSYVTLDDLCEMVQDKIDFKVVDAKTNEDITRSVLTQIIADQESQEGNSLLPLSFMKNLISFYGDNIQSMVPGYLENSFDLFVQNQEKLREQISKSLEDISPMGDISNKIPNIFPNSGKIPPALEELQKKNIAMFERTMKMFTPFGMPGTHNKDDKTEN